jgi:hypothetical protein
VDVHSPKLRPLTFTNPERFRPRGPAPLTSRVYARDLNEVKALGRADSAVRTPAQTETARFWSDNSIMQWSQTLRDL